ncbi:hypothetical protein BDW42DRAFT_186504 [Aspergillus taichungensis]|uniref:Aminoglycoside phosphotransferase domain-containing protein n=1 Tax=Aspergillus taichungensis TaxID=482145 RepID=A0A2J5HR78_9EURO|nr:hypothetical protein BDW42DRAFT_186504 [Aspergillus taichungensis]
MNYILNKLFGTTPSLDQGFGVHPNGVPTFKGSNPPPGFEDIIATIRVDQVPAYASAIFKVPGETEVDSEGNYDARLRLSYKAKLRRVLRRETSIPVPDVYDFNETCDNELNCPFTRMEYITGVTLMQLWFDPKASPEEAKTRRTRALTDLAAAMVQLDRYRFDQAGAALFGDDGRISGTEFPDSGTLNIPPEAIPDLTARLTPKLYCILRLNGLELPPDGPVPGPMQLLTMLFDWMPTPEDDGKGPPSSAGTGRRPSRAPSATTPTPLDSGPSPEGAPPPQTRNSIVYLSLMYATKGREPFMPVLEGIMRLILQTIREEVLPRLRATPGCKAAEVDLGNLELRLREELELLKMGYEALLHGDAIL